MPVRGAICPGYFLPFNAKIGQVEHGYFLYITVKKSQGRDGTCLGYVLSFTAKHFRAGVEYIMVIFFTSLLKMSGQWRNIGWLFPSLYCKTCQAKVGSWHGYFLPFTASYVRGGVEYALDINYDCQGSQMPHHRIRIQSFYDYLKEQL